MALATRGRPVGRGAVRGPARGRARAGARPGGAGRRRRARRARRRPARPRPGARRARRRGLAARQRGDARRAGREPLPGGDLDGFVLVGCDPALGLAAAMLPSSGPRRVDRAVGLDRDRARRDARRPRARRARARPRARGCPRRRRARCGCTWRAGASAWPAAAAPARDRRARASGARVVQREEGASSQKAFAAAVAAEGAPLPPGPVAAGHLDVARRVAYGAPRRRDDGARRDRHGAGVRAARGARRRGLGRRALARAPGGRRARASCCAPAAFTARLGLVGGYDLGRLR